MIQFTLLLPQMEFRRSHGHFNVPNPRTVATEACTEEGDPSVAAEAKSEAYRLYKWVKSLHRMYRSYKLDRLSGSLTDERILLLVKHGFVFQND